MTTRAFPLAALWTFALSLAIGCESNETQYPSSARLTDVQVSLPEAVETALADVGEGMAVEAELEAADREPRWDIDVLVGDVVTEVFIDAVNGRVVQVREEPEDLEDAKVAATALAEGAVSLADAAAAAEESTGGFAVEVEVDVEDAEPPIIEVVVVTDDGAVLVGVALADGSIDEVEPGAGVDEEETEPSGDGA